MLKTKRKSTYWDISVAQPAKKQLTSYDQNNLAFERPVSPADVSEEIKTRFGKSIAKPENHIALSSFFATPSQGTTNNAKSQLLVSMRDQKTHLQSGNKDIPPAWFSPVLFDEDQDDDELVRIFSNASLSGNMDNPASQLDSDSSCESIDEPGSDSDSAHSPLKFGKFS